MERVRNRPKREIHYTVLPSSELHQLQQLASSDAAERQRAEQEEREYMKTQSEARVRNWPNTIEALRLRKEQDRKDRLAKEEEARCAVDAEEAEYQNAQRKAAIERANLILYEQDDRIKNFNSKMFLSHVLEERQKQLELSEAKKEMEAHKEHLWNVKLQDQLEQAKKDEDRRQRARHKKALDAAQAQKEQLDDIRERTLQRQEEEKKEAQRIREAAEKAAVEELEAEQKKRRRAMDLADAYREANQLLEHQKEEQGRKDEYEDMKIRKFAQLKEEQMIERKRRADEKFRKEQERRQRMIQKQSEYLQSQPDTQKNRMERQSLELQTQNEQREAMEKEKRAKHWEEIKLSRTRQLRLREKKKQLDLQEQAAFRKQWAHAAEHLLMQEMDTRKAKGQKNRRLLEFQKMQMHEKDLRRQSEKEQERMEGEMMKKALEDEEQMFQRYVETVMSEYSDKGRNLSTMRSIQRRGEM
eukprot:NODE_568_length_1605_cov_56.003856_g467_i0.p1 GENE.NODE_568_length_1605_cov_56.003856_g467_i0~~NODE_568_length_1605_cov_56.003856_g467_i0.p1  ORF type:complete len:471 (-),score=193.45 NODE_568_length_1605_cov_56.003856_g467_i0:150-1562(-)